MLEYQKSLAAAPHAHDFVIGKIFDRRNAALTKFIRARSFKTLICRPQSSRLGNERVTISGTPA
jgi:hypothetical protein